MIGNIINGISYIIYILTICTKPKQTSLLDKLTYITRSS